MDKNFQNLLIFILFGCVCGSNFVSSDASDSYNLPVSNNFIYSNGYDDDVNLEKLLYANYAKQPYYSKFF